MFQLRLILALLLVNEAISTGYYNSTVFFFYGDVYDTYEVYDLDNAVQVIQHPSFDPAKKIMLYSHGYIESADSDTVRAIVDAYINNGNYNILVLDWRELAKDINYVFVTTKLGKLGVEVATQLLPIGELFPLEQIHFVGHSLGGQLGGYVGREVISQSGKTKKLKRLSALDPAGPNFSGITIGTKRLTKNDAEFVDVIHTDAGAFGYPDNTGTIDFYPNKGRRTQPGCFALTDVFCSHQRSVYYWAESVFKGDDVSFLSRRPSGGPIIQMGNNCPLSATGAYDLSTRDKPPYSLD